MVSPNVFIGETTPPHLPLKHLVTLAVEPGIQGGIARSTNGDFGIQAIAQKEQTICAGVALLLPWLSPSFFHLEVKFFDLNNEQQRMIFLGNVGSSNIKRKAETLIFLPAFLCQNLPPSFAPASSISTSWSNANSKGDKNSPWSSLIQTVRFQHLGATSPLKPWKKTWYDVLMYYLCMKKYQPILNNGVVSNWLQCKKHTSFKRQVKRWKWSQGETLWSCEGDLVTHWNSYKTKGGFNHHTTKNIQCIVNIAFLECEYEIYQKNEETTYLSLDISHLQLLRSCFHAVTCLYRFKKSKSLPLDLRLCQDA